MLRTWQTYKTFEDYILTRLSSASQTYLISFNHFQIPLIMEWKKTINMLLSQHVAS